jgi:membrane protein
MMHYLQRVMPPSGYEIVHKTFLSVLNANNERTLVIGLVASLWTAAYGMSSAQDVLNAIYRVEETRSFWKAKLIAMLLTLVTFVVVFISMMLLILGEYVIKMLKSQALFGESSLFGPGIDMGWKAAQICASLLLVALLFAMIYRWAPHREHARWQWITLGSTVGIAGWLAVSIGFRIYLRYFNHYAVTYGSFGAVIILLTWFYVTGLMLLLGAEINANIDRAKAENVPAVESKIEAA